MPPIPVFQNWKRSSLSSASLRWPRLSSTTSLLQSNSCGECFESHCRHVKKYMDGIENFRRLYRIKTCTWVLICSGNPWEWVDSAQHPVFHWTEHLCQPSMPGPHQCVRRCVHSLRLAASVSWLFGQLAGVCPAQALPSFGQLVFSRAQTLCPRRVAKGKEEGEAVPTLEVVSLITLPWNE